jgi:hypothetical protein
MRTLVAIVIRLLPRKIGAGCRLKKPSRNDDASQTTNLSVIHVDFYAINCLSGLEIYIYDIISFSISQNSDFLYKPPCHCFLQFANLYRIICSTGYNSIRPDQYRT